MKKFLIAICLFLALSSHSQRLGQITFSGGADLSYFTFITDQNVLIRVSPDGKIIGWGIEVMSDRASDYYSPKLQPFMGRVDNYGPEADSAFRGLVRNIGTCTLTYYGPYEVESKRGKLKSVGSLYLDYYDEFGNAMQKGKFRFIGSQIVEWYASYEEETVRGKLKSIANMPITYYTIFDDKYVRGKIKSVGTVSYQWYTSYDQYGGGLKSGSYRRNINGITFIVQ